MKTLHEFIETEDLYDLKCYTTYFELGEDELIYLWANIEQVIETCLDENEPEKIFFSPTIIVHHITDYAEYYIWFENNEVYIERFEDMELNHLIEADIDIDFFINKFYRDGLAMSEIMGFLKL